MGRRFVAAVDRIDWTELIGAEVRGRLLCTWCGIGHRPISSCFLFCGETIFPTWRAFCPWMVVWLLGRGRESAFVRGEALVRRLSGEVLVRRLSGLMPRVWLGLGCWTRRGCAIWARAVSGLARNWLDGGERAVARVWPCRNGRRRDRTRRCGSCRRSRRVCLAGLGWRAGRDQRDAPVVFVQWWG